MAHPCVNPAPGSGPAWRTPALTSSHGAVYTCGDGRRRGLSKGTDRMGSREQQARMKPATPLWLSISAGAALLAACAFLLLAADFTRKTDRIISSIESRYTIGGWRNESVVEEAISSDPSIPRYRAGRTISFIASGVFFAGSIGLLAYEMSQKRKKAAILEGMEGETKLRLTPQIRGFITLHVATLAQKRMELRVSNAYGVIDEGAWHQELVYFVNRVLRPAIGPDAELFTFVELKAMIEKQISMLG